MPLIITRLLKSPIILLNVHPEHNISDKLYAVQATICIADEHKNLNVSMSVYQ